MSTAPYTAAAYPTAQPGAQPAAQPAAQPTGKEAPAPWPMPHAQPSNPGMPPHATQEPLVDVMTPSPGTTPAKPAAQPGLMYPPGPTAPAAAPGTPISPGTFANGQPTATTAAFAAGANVSPGAYNPTTSQTAYASNSPSAYASTKPATAVYPGQQTDLVTLDATAQPQPIPTVQVLPNAGVPQQQLVQQPITPEMMAELNRRALQMVACGAFKDLSSRVQEMPAARIQGIDEALTRVLALKEKINELQKKRVHYHGHLSANAGVAAASAIFTAGTSLIFQGAGGLHQYNRLRQIVRAMKDCLDQVNQLRAEFDTAPGWEVLEGQVRIVEKVFGGSGIDRSYLHGNL